MSNSIFMELSMIPNMSQCSSSNMSRQLRSFIIFLLGMQKLNVWHLWADCNCLVECTWDPMEFDLSIDVGQKQVPQELTVPVLVQSPWYPVKFDLSIDLSQSTVAVSGECPGDHIKFDLSSEGRLKCYPTSDQWDCFATMSVYWKGTDHTYNKLLRFLCIFLKTEQVNAWSTRADQAWNFLKLSTNPLIDRLSCEKLLLLRKKGAKKIVHR